MLLAAVSSVVLYFVGCIERGTGMPVNLQDFEESDIYDLEPWDPSASTPWSFLYSSFTPEPCYWDVILPWEDNPYDLGASVASNAAYCNLNSGHTMCIYPGPSTSCASATQFRELTTDAKTAILDKHNELRAKVANGQQSGQPAASNMQKLVWNTELEAISQRLADQCVFAHDSVRNKIDGTSVGQNLYISFNSAQQAESAVQASMANSVQAWYDEVTDPGFDSANISPFVFSSGAGHYTQVVWADTSEVGCGQVYYLEDNWYKTLIVCNYAVAGNLQGGTMYQQGTACSGCTAGQTCDNGLCV